MKLLLLDTDGTLVAPKSGKTFVQSPDDQVLLPGVGEVLTRYIADRWTPVIVSNQGGVSAGHKTLEDTIAEMHYCLELLPGIDLALFCPDEGATCYRVRRGHVRSWGGAPFDDNIYAYGNFRKPGPGMLNFAVNYGLRPSDGPDIWATIKRQSLMVGDRPEDEGSAQAAGVPFMNAEDWRAGK